MLFCSWEINGMALTNRLVRSATGECLATPEGRVTPALENKMIELAEGGVGLVITGHMYVQKQGCSEERQLAIHEDRCVEGLKRMVERVHQSNGRIVAQLSHAGVQADPVVSGEAVVAASAATRADGVQCSAITEQEIAECVLAFQKAALRAVEAGFDGVQIHGAHGYLLGQFLSPAENCRTDSYGGSFENRTRFLVDVYEAIRKTVGDSYPVMLKLNCSDFVEDGFSYDESFKLIKLLEEKGLDAVEISGGLRTNRFEVCPARPGALLKKEAEAWYRVFSKRVKKETKIPVILVGGLRSFENSNELLRDGITDAIAMCRPLICEPALARRWASGDTECAKCIGCNKCFGTIYKAEGLHCPRNL